MKASAPPAIPWQTATVVGIKPETARAKTFRLALAQTARHIAGQHYVLRLTAPDGYTASRSYSVASAPDESNELELTVERLEGGEISTFLHDEVIVGDELEVRGPIGGWFVWDAMTPAILLGGGSGVVPLMAMLRLARRVGTADLARLVVSVRAPGDLYYADEIVGPETTLVFTRESPPTFARPPGRLTRDDIPQPIVAGSRAYICGSSGFADAASGVLLDLGVHPEHIRVERFGPSG
jgi:ferredoxin-NADP reductase